MTDVAAGPLSRYSADRPLALLTDWSPDRGGGGGVIFRSLLGPDERARMAWMTPTPPEDPAEAGPNVVALRSGSAARGRRSVGRDSTIHAADLAREVVAEAESRGARALWVVMHGACVPVAARLVRWGRLPVHLTVHDDPYGIAVMSRRYLALAPWVARDLARSLRGAASVDVIGPGMADRYRRLHGVESTIVHRALPGPVEPSGDYDAARNGLRVGVLGTMYGYAALPRLARAVELAAGRLGVAPRLLVVCRGHGDRVKAEFAGRVEVEVADHVPEAEGVRRLRDCFASYMNYPFGRRAAVFRQTSYPTKMSTYIQAARPVLVHSPTDSSVAPLAGPGGLGIGWHDLDPGRGAEALVRAWGQAENHASRHEAAELVRLERYDPDRNRRALFGPLDALVSPRPDSSLEPRR